MRRSLVMGSLLALAACNQGPSVTAKNASVEEVAGKVRDAGGAVKMKPGEWVTEARLDSLDIPGMPPAAAEQMKAMMAKQVSGHKFCLTQAMADRPAEDFFSGKRSGCRYDDFKMDGGKVSGTMRCGQGGPSQVVQFAGNYTPTDYQMTMHSTVDNGPRGTMKMAMSMTSKRVGDCTEGSASDN
jgi:hypothetical protein